MSTDSAGLPFLGKVVIVTGAASGIGLDLAHLCAQNHYDLIIAADDASVFDAAEALARLSPAERGGVTDFARFLSDRHGAPASAAHPRSGRRLRREAAAGDGG